MATRVFDHVIARSARLLGGAAVFGHGIADADRVIARLRLGLPIRSLLQVAEALGIPAARLIALVGASSRARRRRSPRGMLDVVASDRLFRVAEVLAEATEA